MLGNNVNNSGNNAQEPKVIAQDLNFYRWLCLAGSVTAGVAAVLMVVSNVKLLVRCLPFLRGCYYLPLFCLSFSFVVLCAVSRWLWASNFVEKYNKISELEERDTQSNKKVKILLDMKIKLEEMNEKLEKRIMDIRAENQDHLMRPTAVEMAKVVHDVNSMMTQLINCTPKAQIMLMKKSLQDVRSQPGLVGIMPDKVSAIFNKLQDISKKEEQLNTGVQEEIVKIREELHIVLQNIYSVTQLSQSPASGQNVIQPN